MTPSDFQGKFSEEIGRVPDLSAKDATKWRPLEAWLGDMLGLPPGQVVVGYAREAQNIWNRLRQRQGDAKLRVLVVDRPSVSAAQRILEDLRLRKSSVAGDALLLVEHDAAAYRVVDLGVFRRPAPPFAVKLAELLDLEPPEGLENEERLAAELHAPVQWVRDLLWLLEDKRGLVLYGPPGTGKTFVAQKLARFVQPDDALRVTVQLHPSFGYEDFFEGYRPTESAGGLTLSRRDGPLRGLVRRLDSPEKLGVLLLDEMNRGNLPRVFGELYYLLEYRNETVRLMYSPDEEFTLPDGLRIIGTMNTADRSVALLDQALRRRFHFVGLFPREPPVDGVLRRYLHENYGSALDWVAEVLDAANARLDRNLAIGPSHFLRRDLDEDTVRRIWRHSVLPAIEEQYFGQEDRLAEFELEALRRRLDHAAADPTA